MPIMGGWIGKILPHEKPKDDVAAIGSMCGTTYGDSNCSGTLNKAHEVAAGYNPNLNAEGYWKGSPQLDTVQEAPAIGKIDTSQLKRGDIAAFGPKHVAEYGGAGSWMDSTPDKGVGQAAIDPKDSFYSGPVRVQRFHNIDDGRLGGIPGMFNPPARPSGLFAAKKGRI